MHHSRLLVAALFLAAISLPLRAADWPHFMGPNDNGVSTETGLASWPTDGPKMLWKVNLGRGFGGPAIADGKVYLLDHIGEEQDKLRCFDAATGKEDWFFAYDAPGKIPYEGSRSTPTIDGDRVYTAGPFGHVYCIDIKTHKPIWSTNVSKDLKAQPGGWRFAFSPLVHKEMVIVSVQSKDTGLAALNKMTGQVIWKSSAIGGSDTYTSPQPATLAGVEQILSFQNGNLSAVNPADGKILWKYTGYRNDRPIPNATVCPGDRVFITGGYGGGCAMLQITHSADKWEAKELWKDTRSGSKIPPALLWKDHLYTNAADIGAGLQCITLDGTVKWDSKTQNKRFDMGHLLIADGLIYLLHGQKGTLHLIEATPDGYKELATAPVLGGQNIWAPMALSNGKLYLRDQSQLKCLDVSGK